MPALATFSPCAWASLVALSISVALSPTETMKCEAEAALSRISPVVCVLLGHRAVDVVEHRADRLDRLRNTMHGVDRARGVALQRVDLFGNLLGGVLGLHRQRLDLGGHHGKAAAGGARTRGLDGGVERQQRGLPRDLRDQIDDIADRGRGFPQAIDIGASLARGGAGLVGELAGVAHLGADPFRRMGEFVGGLAKTSSQSIAPRWCGRSVRRYAHEWSTASPRSPPRRRQPNGPRARAGGSCRRVRVPAAPGFPWRNRYRRKRWWRRARSRPLEPSAQRQGSRLRHSLSKQTERHGSLVSWMPDFLHQGVKSGLTTA